MQRTEKRRILVADGRGGRPPPGSLPRRTAASRLGRRHLSSGSAFPLPGPEEPRLRGPEPIRERRQNAPAPARRRVDRMISEVEAWPRRTHQPDEADKQRRRRRNGLPDAREQEGVTRRVPVELTQASTPPNRCALASKTTQNRVRKHLHFGVRSGCCGRAASPGLVRQAASVCPSSATSHRSGMRIETVLLIPGHVSWTFDPSQPHPPQSRVIPR